MRYYGEPVALLVGETPYAVSDAADLVSISYEDLPVVTDTEDALHPESPLLHETGYDLGDDSFSEALSATDRPKVAHEVRLGLGDVDGVLSSSLHIVETTMWYPMLYAYANEPYNALARFDDGFLDVISTA